MKRLRVLVLLHPDLMPPDSSKGFSEQEINVWKTEYDVVSTLRAAGTSGLNSSTGRSLRE
jgi:D-alanine-D-alanine ligase